MVRPRALPWRLLPPLALLALLLAAPAALAAERLRVEIRGVEQSDIRDNLLAALAPSPGIEIDGRVNRPWLEHYRRRAPQLAAAALKPFGYYRAEVDTQLAILDGEIYRLTVNVELGEPLRVSTLKVAVSGPGSAERPLQRRLAAFPLKEGGLLRQDLYEAAKDDLLDEALALGYLAAAFTEHTILVDLERNSAAVTLLLTTGDRHLFGEARLSGADRYPEPFLRRYLAFAPGDTFAQQRLGQTQLNFLNSDRFREVQITPRLEETEERRVPVDIQLTPSRHRRLRPGIGYGTDTGARASVNYRNLNMFERGHELAVEIKAAERQQAASLGYTLPSHRTLGSQVALLGGYHREKTDTYDSSRLFIEGEVLRSLPRGRVAAAYLRLLQEDFTIGEQDERQRMVLPGLHYTQRRFDDPLDPRKGYQYRLEVRGTHQALGSDSALLQALATGSLLRPLPARFSVQLRAQLATTWQDEELEAIPPSLRFFAGGDQSVRGYAYQSLGPRDGNGDVIGGKHLLVGSVELQRRLAERWGVALFYDAGNAFDSFSDYEIAQGAGLGVRYHTPVGPLRIDLARQLGVSDPSFRLHLSIGVTW